MRIFLLAENFSFGRRENACVTIKARLQKKNLFQTIFSVGRGGNARVAIEARLKQLAISQAGQEACAWHAALAQFLGLVGVIVGLFCVIVGLFCVILNLFDTYAS